jgi:hypothetical protein
LERANESQAPFVEGALVYAIVGRVFSFGSAKTSAFEPEEAELGEKSTFKAREDKFGKKLKNSAYILLLSKKELC